MYTQVKSGAQIEETIVCQQKNDMVNIRSYHIHLCEFICIIGGFICEHNGPKSDGYSLIEHLAHTVYVTGF